MSLSDSDKVVLFATAAQQAGTLPAALEDILRRGLEAFQGRDCDAIDARQFLEALRTSDKHLYPPSTAEATPAPAPSTIRSRRPPPVTLSVAQIKALENLPPTQRLTRYREIQQRRAETTS